MTPGGKIPESTQHVGNRDARAVGGKAPAPLRRRAVRKAAWLFAVAAVVAALAVADRAGLFGRAAGSDVATYHDKAFTVVRVVDGDTLDIDHPDAVRHTRTTRIRLLGIDTPETVRPNTPVQHFGPEAGAFTKKTAGGKQIRVRLTDNGRTRGDNRRLLAYLLLDDGRMLNRLLVAEGYAYADPRYPHPLRSEFASIMAEARKARRGLWAEATEADLPYYLGGPDRR